MALAAGSRLGPYEILAPLGQGGIGLVYKARDTQLDRLVAIKVLKPDKVADADRKSRFIQEARAASALNHPNIVTIYNIGNDGDVDFIAMEFIAGRTLERVIPRGGLKLADLLRYSVQVADALARAHGAGIIHRDLKPGNIMISDEGPVKLVDFGLAKLSDVHEATDAELTGPASPETAEGQIIGTVCYMSPEQAEARKTDARSDIFSFGAVLYEMATGRRAFLGRSMISTLAAILHTDPAPAAEINPGIPHDLARIIERCLRKDPSRRYQSAADLKVSLFDLQQETESGLAKVSPARRGSLYRRLTIRHALLLAALVAAAVVISGIRAFRHPPETASLRTVKFTITPAQLLRGSEGDIDAEVSISRDGKHIAYVESPDGQLWVRDIDEEQARPVPGATSVYQAFWSPDSQYIGYAAGRNCGIRAGCDLVRIPAQGGMPALITKLQGGFKRASWSSDGETIVYCDGPAGTHPGGLYTVPTRGGSPTRIIEHRHIEHPSYLNLPDGRRAFLYQTGTEVPGKHGIYVQLVGDSQRRLITMSSSGNPYPAYSPSGHIVYVDGDRDSSTIWALPFSLATLQATGKAFPIARGGSSPMVSGTGSLVYSDVPSNRRQLVWCDLSGKTISTIGEPRWQNDPTLSPDGRRLTVEVREKDTDLWVYDLERGVNSRFTFDSAVETLGAWTPPGDQITYASNRGGNFDLFSKPSSGNGDERLLVSTPLEERAPDWSPDQKFLIYVTISPETQGDLLYRERRKDGSLTEPVTFLKTPFDERAPRFSPDGRFVVYVSDESGRNEIYVRDFPSGANKWQISANGGAAPRWRRDGKEIFFVEGGAGLMAVSVVTRPAFAPGPPKLLFDKRPLAAGYDVAADGKRFIVLEKPIGEPPTSIHVVHNWFEDFRGQQQ